MSLSAQTGYHACGHILLALLLLTTSFLAEAVPSEFRPRANGTGTAGRERISLNSGWKFSRFTTSPDSVSYTTLKQWILPQANDFIDGAKHEVPSAAAPGADVKQAQASFADGDWEKVDLPHDWAIKGPFNAPGVSGGMGRLPSNGIGWYRRNFSISSEDQNKSIFLDVDGAMSYAAVWLNGEFVGGWPYGYASFRLDLTPHLKVGDSNQLAIRLENAQDNSRWYPGGGIYRNVWLVKLNPTHVGQSGTYVTTPKASNDSAIVNLVVEVENKGKSSQKVDVATEIHTFDPASGKASGDAVANFEKATASVDAGKKQSVNGSVTVTKPLLWGPRPAQTPNLYVAVTTLSVDGTVVDTYETRFGIRTIEYDGEKGVIVNGQVAPIQGVCMHHDHGSLGSAFHLRAAERQLEVLQEMGSNAVRTSHNPPAPELLDLADRLGILILDEIFDCWNNRKTTNDFQKIFADWHEPDLRAFIRRDRNHPSIIAWSVGNEVGEQSSAAGGSTGKALRDIARSEDPTRPVTVAMNSAGAGSALAGVLDIEGLNYQGEGLGTSTSGSFSSFHRAFPEKIIWSSESSSALSTRGTYIFPVTSAKSATAGGNSGGNQRELEVSAYELYATGWGSSPDKVFEAHDRNPYVAGEFVWTGWDYLGEPTPYDSARSSYFGIVDLAGFKKDRFFLYQARWRPDLPMAHLLPHWTWPDRVGDATPVHVFSSGDEAELFVNGVSAGRQKRKQYAYRFRWDDVTYQPGNISVVAYKDGKQWATDTRVTTGAAARLNATADHTSLRADDAAANLAFVSVAVLDSAGNVVPDAAHEISFSVASGPAHIVSTDNGDPGDMTAFPSLKRKAFSGWALAIVKADPGGSGEVVVSAAAEGLEGAKVTLQVS